MQKKEISKLINYETLMAVIENLQVSINIFDLNGKRIFANPYFYYLTGRSKGSFLSSDMLVGENVKKGEYITRKLKEAIKKKKNFKIHNFFYHSSRKKTNRYFDFLIGPLIDKKENVFGGYTIVKDVTLRYLARKKLIKLKKDLERNVKEKTEKLVRANDEMKKMSKLRNDFVSDIAHEIKTVLTIIRGNIDILDFEEKNDNPLTIECKNEVKREIEKLSKIVSDLVFMNKTEEYTKLFNTEKINIYKLIKNILNSFKAIIKNKEIKVAIKVFPNKNIFIKVDKSRISTLLCNLIENALKFGRLSGKMEIRISQGKGKTIFIIKDDGAGIEREKLPLIFEPFFQVNKTGDPKIKERGFGLGLAICKKIISVYNGEIRVESAGLGKGASFIFSLPR